MPSERDLRRRVRSIKNIQQLTRAMQLVAASKMRRAEEAVLASRPFEEKLRSVLNDLAPYADPELSPLLQTRELKKVAVVLITTDRGLVGPMNVNLVRATTRFLRERPAASYIAVGRKGINSLRRMRAPVTAEFPGIPDRPSTADTNYTAVYTFQVVGPTGTVTNVSSVAYISSGGNVKHTDTGNFTFANYRVAYGNVRHLQALVNSLELGIGVALLATLFAVPIAWAISRTDMPAKAFVRLRSTRGDGQFDEIKELLKTDGGVGHGRNHVKLGPEGMIYLVHGNNVVAPPEAFAASPLRRMQDDRLIPCPWDPQMFDGDVSLPAGHILRTDPNGETWELIAGGFRNELDIDWNEAGDMFTDSDVRGAVKTCVVGTTLARELFGDESPIGQDIRVQNVALRIVGVLSKKGAESPEKATLQKNVDRLRQETRRTGPTAGGTGSDSDGGLVAVKVRDVLGEQKKNPTVAVFAAGLGVMFLLFSAAGAGGALIEEVESGTLDRVLSTRVTMTQLLLGKLLYLATVAVAQLTVMFLWGELFFGLELHSHVPGFVVMAVVTALAASAFGLVLAALSRTRMQLVALSNLLILVMSALGGSMFPRYLLSESVQKIGLVTLNAWAIDGFMKVFWRDEPLVALLPQVGVLAAAAVVLFSLARRLARRWEVV